MPRFRDESSLRLWDFFPNPPSSRCSLSSRKVDGVHAICSSEDHVRKRYFLLINALVEETAKGIRKLKKIFVPSRKENG